MKKTIATLLFVSCVSIIFPQNSSYLKNSEAARVIMGLFHALQLGGYSEKGLDSNTDSSLRWTKSFVIVEAPSDPDRLLGKHKPSPEKKIGRAEFVFSDYSFYLLAQNSAGKHQFKPQIITIDGTVALKDEAAFDGKLTVRGSGFVHSIELNDFLIEAPTGSVLINGKKHDVDTLWERIGDMEYDTVIDADMESGIIFFVSLMAMMTTDIPAQFAALGEAAKSEVPAGVTAVNPENTLTITTQKNKFDLTFTDFILAYDFYDINPNPQISGALTMSVNIADGEMDSLTYDGSVDIKKMFLVTSMGFDSCTVPFSMQGLTGTIIVNGKKFAVSKFMYALKSAEYWF